jgi:hypothetical protein
LNERCWVIRGNKNMIELPGGSEFKAVKITRTEKVIEKKQF